MKPISVVFAIIVLVLWLGSATYIAAPDNVKSMLPSPPMGNIPTSFLGVLLFLLSIVVIVLWVGLVPDSTDEKKVPVTTQ